MKKRPTIFTVLILTLFAMPCFAAQSYSGLGTCEQMANEAYSCLVYETIDEGKVTTKCGNHMQGLVQELRRSFGSITGNTPDALKKEKEREFRQYMDKNYKSTMVDKLIEYCNKNMIQPAIVSAKSGQRTEQQRSATQQKEQKYKPAEKPKKNDKVANTPCTATVGGHGTYDNNGKCVITSCDDTKNYVVNKEKTHCILQTTQKIKDNIDTKQEQNAEEKAAKEKCDKATDAKWIAGKCTCNDKTMVWAGTECQKKNGECKDSYFGKGNYNEKGICVINECPDKYVVNKDKNKCELETTANIRDKKAEKETKKLDKEYTSDIKTLIDAFNTKVKELTQACVKAGQTIQNGECQ